MFLHVFIASVSLRQNVGGSAGREARGVAQNAFPSQLRATDSSECALLAGVCACLYESECARACGRCFVVKLEYEPLHLLLQLLNMLPRQPSVHVPPFEVFLILQVFFFFYII